MTVEQIEAILSPYYGALTHTAIEHITEQVLALMPEASESVEWGVRVREGDPDYDRPANLVLNTIVRYAAEALAHRSPETRGLIRRTRTTYAPTVGEWTEVTE